MKHITELPLWQQILPGIWQVQFGETEKNTPSEQRYCSSPLEAELANFPTAALPFLTEDIAFSVSARGCRMIIPLGEDEHIYGFGLQLQSLEQTGKKRCLRVNSDPVTDTGDSHAPIPLYFSSSGYGIMLDTARYATFHTGSNHIRGKYCSKPKSSSNVALDEDELYKAGAMASMIAEVPVAQGIKIYLFGGPDLLSAVRRYVLFCGGGCMPPEWGLGVHYRTCSTADENIVLRLSEEFRQHDIPCDVLGLEPGWQTHAYSCSFLWSTERFPHHTEMLSRLHDNGFRVNLWEHLFIHPESPLYEPEVPYSGDFEVWNGLVPDLSIPEASRIFANYHRENFVNKGIDSFKLDECDNSDFVNSPWSFPECSHFPSGSDGEQMHSLLGMLYQQSIVDAFAQSGKRTWGNVRSSHAFAPSMPFVLYSDLYDHLEFIRGVATCGFGGLLWTPELRHARSQEDYIRRLQSMILSPQFMMNIWSMPHPPWMQLDKELNRAGIFFPAKLQKTLIQKTRCVAEQRMGFLPYLYSAFADYHLEGIPPFRALAMEWPDDERFRCFDRAWMAGKNMLVAPLVAGESELYLPLPPGNWYDFFSGECHSGEVTLRQNRYNLPVFVRENSIIPFAAPLPNTSGQPIYKLSLRLYGPHPEPAFLMADDGIASPVIDSNRGKVYSDGKMDAVLHKRYVVNNICRI